MNSCHIPRSDNASIFSAQRLLEALGRLQSREPDRPLGRLYIFDLVEQCTLGASCSVTALLGYGSCATHSSDPVGLADLIHPDDLASVARHYQRFTTLKSGEVITLDYRMRRADGAWCVLRSQETPLVMASDGFPLQILGSIRPLAPVAPVLARRLGASDRSLKRIKLSRLKAPSLRKD